MMLSNRNQLASLQVIHSCVFYDMQNNTATIECIQVDFSESIAL